MLAYREVLVRLCLGHHLVPAVLSHLQQLQGLQLSGLATVHLATSPATSGGSRPLAFYHLGNKENKSGPPPDEETQQSRKLV